MKLGLIAMSGVRAYNRELTELGLTLPGFIRRNKLIASLPSLGLLTLAGLTPESVDTHYLEVPGDDFDEIPGEYDIVAISSFSARIKDAYRLADRYRKAGTIVVLGGLHVSSMPEEALRHADCVVVGEGELAWPELISDAANGTLRRIYESRGRQFALAEAPMPRFDLLDPENYNRLTVQTQRGCPFRCEFCAASIRIAPNYMTKPVEKVIAEVRRIKEIWAKPFIEFADDNTFVNKRHSKELLRALAKEDIRWFTETDISVADDEELLELMRDSGCAQVLIGFESTSFSGLRGLEQRADWKAKQLGRYKEAIDRVQRHGVSINGCFILGLDGTAVDSFEEIFTFVKESGLSEVQVTVQTPFPGTPLYERLRSTGRLLRDNAWELCTLFDVNFEPEQMSVRELELHFRDLVSRLYSDGCSKERRRSFQKQLRGVRRHG